LLNAYNPGEKHRLQRDAYKGYTRALFTACFDGRAEYFISDDRFKIHEEHLLRALKQHQCQSELYVFMPDHVHLIVTGMEETSDTYAGISKFKQYSGFWLSQNDAIFRWQQDFHDHILREEDDLHGTMLYLLENPVRAGLTENWKQYPYKGSTVFDLRKWS
jgi:REP element-mobilizing transposase RayT